MEFRRLHETLGAEVRGFDLLGPVSEREVNELRMALAEHQLLLFRPGRHMPPERHVEVASWFGRPMRGGGMLCSVLRNDDPAGAERLKFHSDFTYTDSPVRRICLQAIEVPPSGTATAFMSGVHGWATLPAELQDKLAGLTLRHVQNSSLTIGDLPVFVADHPIRYDHPDVKRPVLLVTEYHATRINELPPEESEAMIARLLAHLYRPANIYIHDWRLYDVVLWDNLAIQHSRPVRAAPEDGPRALQRVAIGEADYEELIERARTRERAEGLAGAAAQ
jgi:taurine dioxygenase